VFTILWSLWHHKLAPEYAIAISGGQAARANIRSQVDFESNLQSLIWLVHLAHKSNVDVAHVDKLCAEAIAESRNMA
jgi:hypothetical protein